MHNKINWLFRLAVALAVSLLAWSFVSKEPSKRVFQYSDKYSFCQIVLKDNGQFKQRISSCTFAYNMKGTWEEKGDTLILHQKFVQRKSGSNKYIKRYQKYLMKADTVLENIWWGDTLVFSKCMHLQD